jgi:hypothetical protein
MFFRIVLIVACVVAGGWRNSAKAQDERQNQTRNNLKQLVLALYNYYDVNKHFPPAVVMGPDGKTPHSWRVEILPFLDQNKLFQQYKMDEPWDSPSNKKLLERIPEPLRSPYDDPKSTNAGYFALVGPGTAFESKTGMLIREISDGTSNTIMLVESKRKTPWTKPSDIRFDPKKAVPKLGGYVEGEFTAGMCDGTVRPIPLAAVKDTLKWLIIRNDGHAVDVPQ